MRQDRAGKGGNRMRPDYGNWVPKGMVYGLAAGTAAAFAAFLLLGAAGTVLGGTPRLICGTVFGIATAVLLFFTVWMATLHRAFDYSGKRKLAKAIIENDYRMKDIEAAKPVFRLHPPVKGYEGNKRSYKNGGALGYRGEAINDLIARML